MARTLFVLAVLPIATLAPAHGQTGGIQVSPVLVAMTAEHNITSLRVRNGRSDPVSFEVDVYAWRQENGRDVLTPSRDLLVAPGVFEIGAESEQVVRLGVPAPDQRNEQAFRIILRELPRERENGNVLGFTLELSLPVFVSPMGARSAIETRSEPRAWGSALILTNTGRAHAQIASVEDLDVGALPAPRYLLAGASAEIPVPPNSSGVRLRAGDISGAYTKRLVHVDRQGSLPPVR